MSSAISVEDIETAVVTSVITRLQDLMWRAIASVCPEYVTVLNIRKESVRKRQNASTCADLECHAPATMWRKLCASSGSEDRVSITTVSEYGVTREREYADAATLGRAVVEALDELGARADVADARVREDGCLLLTSTLHMRRQRAMGMLHCNACGIFCQGERGLRDHQHIKVCVQAPRCCSLSSALCRLPSSPSSARPTRSICPLAPTACLGGPRGAQHLGSYEGAKQAVAVAKGAIVARAASASATALMSELWAARVAEAARLKRQLPPGLDAAREGDVEALRRLVRGGWDALHTVDRHGSNALHYAAGSGRLEACAFLVDELGVPATRTQPRDGRTALHWAARNGHAAVCSWLVERGVAADVGTHDGTRPLHWAVWQGHLDVCELLLERRADLHSRNRFGCNAIQWAAQSDSSRGLDVCRWLLGRGLDLSLLNCNGHSALHKAAVKGQRAVCEWLLSDEVRLGAAHVQPDGDGNAPSTMARLEGFTELAAYLEASERALLGAQQALGEQASGEQKPRPRPDA